jgi:hypothetical protein
MQSSCSLKNDPGVFQNMSDTYRKNQFKWNCNVFFLSWACLGNVYAVYGVAYVNCGLCFCFCVGLFEHTAAAPSLNVKCSYLIFSYTGVFLNERRIIGRLTVFCFKVARDEFLKVAFNSFHWFFSFTENAVSNITILTDCFFSHWMTSRGIYFSWHVQHIRERLGNISIYLAPFTKCVATAVSTRVPYRVLATFFRSLSREL